jgi:hypothetical protein
VIGENSSFIEETDETKSITDFRIDTDVDYFGTEP